MKNKLNIIICTLVFMGFISGIAFGEPKYPNISLEIGGTDDPRAFSSSIEIIIIFTVLSLLPTIIIMMTSFTRVIIILSFLKSAIGVQQNLPGQVILGLSLFITFFIMAPTGEKVYEQALKPYVDGQITQQAAFTQGMVPLRDFMLKQTREKDIVLFSEMAGMKAGDIKKVEDIPNRVLLPAFMISELKSGFQMGFILFIPFLIVDMVVASTLMSMGMMMLPPVMISLPFKLLLFILADGWNLVIKSIVMGFK
ncbi:MAG: flagellar type III secretion system pore protein FliP [Peptoclostridium sp.]|uniref:flagellar type III secretion system pore protein FliP n=1 Tax=Peptoclostridium sp. TaxID=1904860 RepID=UPI00139D3722|nr:flagellar type III secretion system pore protein FliP [Peptoclostridium sp.]MZQ75136.1 flagellar type III secretion system pore protein FliP [Peptoclostridium sp.]